METRNSEVTGLGFRIPGLSSPERPGFESRWRNVKIHKVERDGGGVFLFVVVACVVMFVAVANVVVAAVDVIHFVIAVVVAVVFVVAVVVLAQLSYSRLAGTCP